MSKIAGLGIEIVTSLSSLKKPASVIISYRSIKWVQHKISSRSIYSKLKLKNLHNFYGLKKSLTYRTSSTSERIENYINLV